MFLPDKIVIDLHKIERVADMLSTMLNDINSSRDYSHIITGNDLEYSSRELLSFKQKLINLINKESKKYQYDIFGNVIKRIDKYQYAELMFSEDYTEITSIRLLGTSSGEDCGDRYVLFNLSNIFEPTVINLLFNSDDIMSSSQDIITDKKIRHEFLKDYFAPFPIFHNINQNPSLLNPDDIKLFLDVFTNKFDDPKPKTYDELVSQNFDLNSIHFKTQIYNIREKSYSEAGGASSMIPGLEAILKIDEKCQIDLAKFKFPEINICEMLAQLNPYEIFAYIDNLPGNIRKSIYMIKIPAVQYELQFLLADLQTYVNQQPLARSMGIEINIANPNNKFKITEIFTDIKNKYPRIYEILEERFNSIFPKELFLEALEYLIGCRGAININLPVFKLPKFNFDIPDLFFNFSININSAISNSLCEVILMITRKLLELLQNQNSLEDFAIQNIFELPQSANSPIFKMSLSNNDWLSYIQYAYNLLQESKDIGTAPLNNRIQDVIPRNSNIRKKFKSKITPVNTETCQPTTQPPKSNINNKILKKRGIKTIKDAVRQNDIDSLIEKLKIYNFSSVHDYFVEQNSSDDVVVDAMRFIADNLKDQQQPPPLLTISSQDILGSTMSMIEQILTILDPQEINSLLDGTYVETTADIVRNIAKINFPTLTYKVDPIKYFTMLGKVVGSKNIPTDLSMSLRNLGVIK
jgi:hypothetical protein